jgi:hypothetical protein
MVEVARVGLGARMQPRAVAPRQQRAAKAARVLAQEPVPGLAGQRQLALVRAVQDLAVHRVQQRALVLEVPVQRGLLHAQPLGQQPGAELVHADLVEQRERRLEDRFAVQFHADVRADVIAAMPWGARVASQAWNLSLIIPYQ